MGYSCRPDNVMLCLSALGSVLTDMGLPIKVGDAEAAAHGRTPRSTRPTRAREKEDRGGVVNRGLTPFTSRRRRPA